MIYKVSLFEGTIERIDNVIESVEVEAKSKKSDDEIIEREVWVEITGLLKRNRVNLDTYIRVVGPFDDKSFTIDFGSWFKFIKIEPLEEVNND